VSIPSQPEPLALPPLGPVAKPKKPFLSPARIVMLVFVVAASVVIVLEGRARWQFSATCRAIEQVIEPGDANGDELYRNDLDRVLCGSPSRKAGEYSETFTWRGVFRSYRMKLRYDRRGCVDGIETVK